MGYHYLHAKKYPVRGASKARVRFRVCAWRWLSLEKCLSHQPKRRSIFSAPRRRCNDSSSFSPWLEAALAAVRPPRDITPSASKPTTEFHVLSGSRVSQKWVGPGRGANRLVADAIRVNTHTNIDPSPVRNAPTASTAKNPEKKAPNRGTFSFIAIILS